MSNGELGFMEGSKRERAQFPESSPEDFYERVAGALDGGLWVVGNGRIRKWSAGKWVKDLGLCPCGDSPVTALCETREGALAVGTLQEGLYLIAEGNPPMHFCRTNGLAHDWVRSICEDTEGDIWVATGGGLDTLRPRKVRMLDAPDHWQGRAVLALASLPDGSAWFGIESYGLYRHPTVA